MRYVSTRGAAPPVEFEEALLAGLAPDGGLYVPEAWPQLDADVLRGFASSSYPEIAARMLAPFAAPSFDADELAALLEDAYAGFGHAATAPLVQLDRNDWLLELFHGPTLAFKDYALQAVGRLFDRALRRRGARATVAVATSGDTGSAAIEACRGLEAVDIFVLHPEGRVSEMQRRQMTTAADANVHNLAIAGSFDDCQHMVKALFADAAFRAEARLSAMNSINWARIAAQTAYYAAAAAALGAPDREVAFAVPTGNFGNVYAGYAARRMGVPISRLVLATNRNDILARFFAGGAMTVGAVVPTVSPSMDIQVASNFERLLFDLLDRDGAAVRRKMEEFGRSGRLEAEIGQAGAVFAAGSRTDAETLRAVARIHARTGAAVDPHTAIGIDVGRALRGDAATPLVALATAHPAKFPDAVAEATGRRPDLPPRLAALSGLAERCARLEPDADALKAYVRARIGPKGAG